MVCAQSTTKLTWDNSARRTLGFFGQWSFGQRMLGGLSATPVLCHCLISLLQDHRDERTTTAWLVQDVSIQRLWYRLLNITYAHVEQTHWKLRARGILGVSLSSLGMKLCCSMSSHLTVSFLYCSLSLPYILAWLLSDPSLASHVFNLKVLCRTRQPSTGGVLALDVSWAVSLWVPCILCCDQGADTPCPRVGRKTSSHLPPVSMPLLQIKCSCTGVYDGHLLLHAIQHTEMFSFATLCSDSHLPFFSP